MPGRLPPCSSCTGFSATALLRNVAAEHDNGLQSVDYRPLTQNMWLCLFQLRITVAGSRTKLFLDAD